jgi:hypothetical protein
MLPPLVDQRGVLAPELIAFIQGLADQLTPISPPVSSVDGRTGAVVLSDLYDAYGTAGGLVASHEGAPDPHPQYATDTALSAVISGLGTAAAEDVSAFDAAGVAAGLIAIHEGDSDPHPTYTTAAELAAAISGLGASASPKYDASTTATSVDNTDKVVASLTLDTIAVGDVVDFSFNVLIFNSSLATRTYTPKIRLNSTNVLTFGTATLVNGSSRRIRVNGKLVCTGTNTQKLDGNVMIFTTPQEPQDGTAAESNTTPVLAMTVRSDVATATQTATHALSTALHIRA